MVNFIGLITLVWGISIFTMFVMLRFFFFLRDPQRRIPPGNNIVSPADGKIVYIRTIDTNEVPILIKKDSLFTLDELYPEDLAKYRFRLVIGIYMTTLSVHYNRAPIEGMIIKSVVRNGRNKSMLTMMMNIIFNLRPYEQNCSHVCQNERRLTLIEGSFPVAIVQIADQWISRIDFFKNINTKVGKGERVGMIRMGSQCDLLLPHIPNFKLKVKEGDWVKAGCDIIGEIE